jgi:hypothetical protein
LLSHYMDMESGFPSPPRATTIYEDRLEM